MNGQQQDPASGPDEPDAPANPLAGLSPFDAIQKVSDGFAQQYGKVKAAYGQIVKVREGLDRLLGLGDMVDQEDVIEEAGKVVAHGVSAVGMATLLAQMPERAGQPIQQWLQAQDTLLRQEESQMEQLLAVTRHRMGVSAMHLLAAHAAGVPGAPIPKEGPALGMSPMQGNA